MNKSLCLSFVKNDIVIFKNELNKSVIGYAILEVGDICIVKKLFFSRNLDYETKYMCLLKLQQNLGGIIITPYDIEQYKKLWINFLNNQSSLVIKSKL